MFLFVCLISQETLKKKKIQEIRILIISQSPFSWISVSLCGLAPCCNLVEVTAEGYQTKVGANSIQETGHDGFSLPPVLFPEVRLKFVTTGKQF